MAESDLKEGFKNKSFKFFSMLKKIQIPLQNNWKNAINFLQDLNLTYE